MPANQVFRYGEHQPRFAVIDHDALVQRSQRHAARALPQRGAPGEQAGAHHAVAAADDADMAEQALVAVPGARGQAVAAFQLRQRDARCGGQVGRIDAEHVEVQLAGVIRAVGGEQTRLESDEGQRVVGAQGDATDAAAVAVEAARHVEREFRAVHFVGLLDPVRVFAVDVALQPHSVQAVDDKAVAPQRRDIRQDPAAVFTPAGPGAGGIRRQAGGVGAADDVDAESLRREPVRGDQGVAAVVAGAGQDQDRRARFAGQRAGQFGCGRARPLHQRGGGVTGRPLPVDFPHGGSREQRRGNEGAGRDRQGGVGGGMGGTFRVGHAVEYPVRRYRRHLNPMAEAVRLAYTENVW